MSVTFLTNEDEKKYVRSVNGAVPDENGNVEVVILSPGGNVDLDTTLTQSGKAADAKAVGDEIANVRREVQSGVTDEQIASAVEEYLEEHPSGEKVDKYHGSENAYMLLYVGRDGNISLLKAGEEISVKSDAKKNIVFGEWEGGRYVDGVWTASAVETSKNFGINERFAVTPGATYTISIAERVMTADNVSSYIFQYNENGDFIAQTNYTINLRYDTCKTFTVSQQTHFIAIHFYGTGGSGWRDYVPKDFMIEPGKEQTEYEPYISVDALELDKVKTYDGLAKANLVPARQIVPGYYEMDEYIDEKCKRIRALLDGCAGDGDAFVFVTDQHWTLNAQKSPALINYLSKRVHIPRVFSGGDTDDYASEDYANALEEAFGGGIHHAMGNHDWFGDLNGNKLAYIFDIGKMEQIGNAKRHYYYVDNPQQSIRYIVLSAFSNESGVLGSAYDAEQVAWLRDVALAVEDGWTVLVFTHCLYTCSDTAVSFVPSPEGASDIVTVLDSAKCEIACVVQGHLHRDRIGHTPGGIPVVTTTCDKYQPWMRGETNNEPWLSNRVDGTITEQAFDVVVLDKAARKLTFVRIGAPADDWTDGVSTGTVEERSVTY